MTGTRASRHEIDAALAALEIAELHCLPDLTPHLARFWRIGNALVRPGLLATRMLPRALGLGRGQGVPAPLRRFRAARLCLAALAAPRHSANSSADAIVLDRNVRAFYPPGVGATIKVQGAAAGEGALAHEVEVRREIERTRSVRLPRLLGCDIAAARPFLCEETIVGRRAQAVLDGPSVLTEVLPAFCRLYRALGLDTVPSGAFFDLAGIRQAVVANLPLATLDDGRRSRILAWADGIETLAGAALPAGMAHGDLSYGNMLVDGRGLVWVVDWETARRAPILWDWRKLLGNTPGCSAVYDRFVAELYPAGLPEGMMPLREQRRLMQASRVCEMEALQRARGASAAVRGAALRAVTTAFADAFDAD